MVPSPRPSPEWACDHPRRVAAVACGPTTQFKGSSVMRRVKRNRCLSEAEYAAQGEALRSTPETA
jgi:hypothetical protein